MSSDCKVPRPDSFRIKAVGHHACKLQSRPTAFRSTRDIQAFFSHNPSASSTVPTSRAHVGQASRSTHPGRHSDATRTQRN